LLFGGIIITAVGFIDDLGHIPARWRFLTHSFAVVFSLSLLTSLPEIPLFGSSFDLGIFGYVFFVVYLVWFINLFNFMDGIDGIAGVEAITALGGGALIMSLHGQSDWLALFGFLAACVAGFLVWNWPPAKVFMGDACSGFLGFTLGFFAIVTSTDGVMNIWSWLILFGVFVVDATTTLITRMVFGERWFEAHRSHAYQILSRRYHSHWKVSVGVLVINIVWLLPFALLATKYPYWSVAICCVALLPLLLLAIRVGAGKREVEA
jgi:Fuc2NAc and GlcNAc transferase